MKAIWSGPGRLTDMPSNTGIDQGRMASVTRPSVRHSRARLAVHRFEFEHVAIEFRAFFRVGVRMANLLTYGS